MFIKFLCDNGGNLVCTLLGAIISWAVTKRYYVKAAKDLESASNRTTEQIDLILLSLESAGFVSLARDADTNKIRGINMIVHAPAAEAHASGIPPAVSVLDEKSRC